MAASTNEEEPIDIAKDPGTWDWTKKFAKTPSAAIQPQPATPLRSPQAEPETGDADAEAEARDPLAGREDIDGTPPDAEAAPVTPSGRELSPRDTAGSDSESEDGFTIPEMTGDETELDPEPYPEDALPKPPKRMPIREKKGVSPQQEAGSWPRKPTGKASWEHYCVDCHEGGLGEKVYRDIGKRQKVKECRLCHTVGHDENQCFRSTFDKTGNLNQPGTFCKSYSRCRTCGRGDKRQGQLGSASEAKVAKPRGSIPTLRTGSSFEPATTRARFEPAAAHARLRKAALLLHSARKAPNIDARLKAIGGAVVAAQGGEDNAPQNISEHRDVFNAFAQAFFPRQED